MEQKQKTVEMSEQYWENKKIVRENISILEILAGLAEECAELAHAALKLRRVFEGSNPTPKKEEEAIEDLYEEIADVRIYEYLLNTNGAYTNQIIERKMERFAKRLLEKRKREEEECEESEEEQEECEESEEEQEEAEDCECTETTPEFQLEIEIESEVEVVGDVEAEEEDDDDPEAENIEVEVEAEDDSEIEIEVEADDGEDPEAEQGNVENEKCRKCGKHEKGAESHDDADHDESVRNADECYDLLGLGKMLNQIIGGLFSGFIRGNDIQ